MQPTPVSAPQLVATSAEVLELLDLDAGAAATDEFLQMVSGNRLLPGMDPHATCYGGHQFGNWAGQLGDGRAINLGEIKTAGGAHWMLQLKGAGPTPYSRTADGLAVLRSSVREFLCSEAMHHLGVPTTRALSLAITGEDVVRDMLYDGHPAPEPGAVVCRVAPSFTRFGHFEMLTARNEVDLLRQFADFTIQHDFAEADDCADLASLEGRDRYVRWFETICRRTADTVVHWMRVGFVHGVMNTDNLSILGLTIDYGPYGWLEDYDPDWTPNTTDAGGKRYRFAHQPAVAHWNLVRLANALYPLIEDAAPLEAALHTFQVVYTDRWRAMMAAKLGFAAFEGEADAELMDTLDGVLQLTETDMTIFFRNLANVQPSHSADTALELLADAYYQPEELVGQVRDQIIGWLEAYVARLGRDAQSVAARRAAMNLVNPKFVLRNYLAQLAIDDATEGDYGKVNELLDVLRTPYDEHPERESWAGRRPDWARTRVGCSMLSCSS